MKTPEEVAAEVVGHYEDRRHIKGRTLTRRVAEAIAAERQRADVLAEALRSIMFLDRDMSMGDIDDVWCNAYDIARAALAAYDTEAK